MICMIISGGELLRQALAFFLTSPRFEYDISLCLKSFIEQEKTLLPCTQWLA